MVILKIVGNQIPVRDLDFNFMGPTLGLIGKWQWVLASFFPSHATIAQLSISILLFYVVIIGFGSSFSIATAATIHSSPGSSTSRSFPH